LAKEIYSTHLALRARLIVNKILEEKVWVESVFEAFAREGEKGGGTGTERRTSARLSIEPLKIVASNTAPLAVAAISAKISSTQR
jgi:hypothetical protein